MFLPATSHQELLHLDTVDAKNLCEEYKQDLKGLVTHLVANLRGEGNPRGDGSTGAEQIGWDQQSGSSHAARTGSEIASYLEILVDAANRNLLGKIPSLWESYLSQQLQQALEHSLQAYRSDIEQVNAEASEGPPQAQNVMKEFFNQIHHRSCKLFHELTFNLTSKKADAFAAKLLTQLESERKLQGHTYDQRVQNYLSIFRDEAAAKMVAFLEMLALPRPSGELDAAMSHKRAELIASLTPLQADYGRHVKDAEDRLYGALTKRMEDKLLRNKKALDKHIRDVQQRALEAYEINYRSELSKHQDQVLTLDQFATLDAAAQRSAFKIWQSLSDVASKEDFFAASVANFKQNLYTKQKLFDEENQARIEFKLQHTLKESLKNAKKQLYLEKSHFPLEDDSLARIKNAVTTEANNAFQAQAKPYLEYRACQALSQDLKNLLLSAAQEFEEENTKALKSKVEEPLAQAYRRVADILPAYWWTYTFRERCRLIATEQIGQQELKPAQRDRVIDLWLRKTEPGHAGYLVSQLETTTSALIGAALTTVVGTLLAFFFLRRRS